MKSDYVVYGALFIVIMILGYTIGDFIEKGPEGSLQQNQLSTKTTGSTNPGDVQIDLTPKGIVNGRFTLEFSANTHSVDLDKFDLAKITTLNTGGRNYVPTYADDLSGHHGSGQIVFDLKETPKSFKVLIRGIPAVEQRILEWP